MNVTVDKSGFVPGEDIIITSEIDNRTMRFLRIICYSIGAEIKYKAFVQEALCDHYREFIEKSELKKMEAVIEAPPRRVTKILGSLQLPKPMFISDMSRFSAFADACGDKCGTSMVKIDVGLAGVSLQIEFGPL
eukprot:g34754.t1